MKTRVPARAPAPFFGDSHEFVFRERHYSTGSPLTPLRYPSRASTGEARCRLSDTIGFEWPAVGEGGRAKEISGMGPRGDLGQCCAMGT